MADQHGTIAGGVRFFGSAFVVAGLLAIATQVSAHSREASPDAAAPTAMAEAAAVDATAEPDATTKAPVSSTEEPEPPHESAVPEATAPSSQESTATSDADPGQVLYFTFDDGPSPTWTPQILELLAAHKARATFFQVGSEAARHPALAAQVRDRGHTVGNHTWSHPDLTRLSAEDATSQLTRTTDVIGPTTCTRPPMGATNASVRSTFADLDQTEQLWDIDTRDWQRPGAASIVSAVLNNAKPGAVVLLHDGGGDRSQTVEALAKLLPQLAKDGWRIDGIPGC